MDRLAELVVKPVDGSGGKGIVIGPRASRRSSTALRTRIMADPRGWIAQPVVQLSTVPTLIGDQHARRATSTCGRSPSTTANRVWVLPGGLTRVALPEGELIVNSIPGGGSKDTWVLAGPGQRPDHRSRETGRPTSRGSTCRRSPGTSVPSPATADPTAARGRSSNSSSNSSRAAARGGGGRMLSRIAESLFWIGRYVERAEDTSRILDVHLQAAGRGPAGRRGSRPAGRCSPSWAVEPPDEADRDIGASASSATTSTSPELDRLARSRAPGRAPGGRARRSSSEMWSAHQHHLELGPAPAGCSTAGRRATFGWAGSGRR